MVFGAKRHRKLPRAGLTFTSLPRHNHPLQPRLRIIPARPVIKDRDAHYVPSCGAFWVIGVFATPFSGRRQSLCLGVGCNACGDILHGLLTGSNKAAGRPVEILY